MDYVTCHLEGLKLIMGRSTGFWTGHYCNKYTLTGIRIYIYICPTVINRMRQWEPNPNSTSQSLARTEHYNADRRFEVILAG